MKEWDLILNKWDYLILRIGSGRVCINAQTLY